MDAVLADIVAMLRKRIGLNPESIRASAIADAVKVRMEAVGDRQPGEYLQRLGRNEEEFFEMVDQVVVPETWFFRDVLPFVCVRDFVKQFPASQHLRLLSLPCSSGEETYSLAMVLLDLGLTPAQFHVDGVDVSRRQLQRAKQASYPKTSFRETDAGMAGLRDRFFRATADGFVLDESVRATVTFRAENLANANLRNTGEYHVVLCRHLLIYLDGEARKTALTNLRRVMAPGGLLYLGHVEAGLAREGGFRPYRPRYPAAFLAGDEPVSRGPAPAPRTVTPKPKPRGARPPSSVMRVPTPVPAAKAPIVPTLAIAKQAADAGRLEEAAGLCEAMLQSQASADVFCLLGVVCQAQGDVAAAERHWSKALYVDPRHHESLVHLELLARRRGDERQAGLLRKRAERSSSGEPVP